MQYYYMAITVNQILHRDWLPDQARWRHLARSGITHRFSQEKFTLSPVRNPQLT